MEILKDLLECTICLEFAISPIQNCSNGHIVCGMCFKKVKKCGMCQEQLVPCGFAERIVRTQDFTLPCTNTQFGCKEIIESTKMISHLDICKYRPFICLLKNYNNCDKTCNMNDFYQHLKETHEIADFGNEPEGSFSFAATLPVLPRLSGSNILDKYKLHGVKKFDGHIFLTFTEMLQNVLVVWKVAIIGGKTEAENYRYCLQLKSESMPDFKFLWKGPVLPILDCKRSAAEYLEISPNSPNLHFPALRPFCTQVENDTGVEDSFITNIKISKTKKEIDIQAEGKTNWEKCNII